MIGKGFRRKPVKEVVETTGFDAFEVRLGDALRGERATLGKSLLDVQRELKIKAAYIAAIENADPTAFDTPGFIAGYVRSYARYLNLDPEWAFETFCRESGFATAHGMSPAASAVKPKREESFATANRDIFASPSTPFIPGHESMLAKIQPGAVGSVMILALLVGGLGFGGWNILKEVQKVQFAPVENTPVVVADLDPLAGVDVEARDAGVAMAAFEAPATEAFDRSFRPQALDVPVLIARDGPISALDPATIGALAPEVDAEAAMIASVVGTEQAQPVAAAVQVTEGPAPELVMVAVRPAWVRVTASDGSVIFEGIMAAGAQWEVPQTEEPATVRVGESGAVYMNINGVPYGPVGERGVVTANLALDADQLVQTYQVADIAADQDLARVVNVAQAQVSQ